MNQSLWLCWNTQPGCVGSNQDECSWRSKWVIFFFQRKRRKKSKPKFLSAIGLWTFNLKVVIHMTVHPINVHMKTKLYFYLFYYFNELLHSLGFSDSGMFWCELNCTDRSLLCKRKKKLNHQVSFLGEFLSLLLQNNRLLHTHISTTRFMSPLRKCKVQTVLFSASLKCLQPAAHDCVVVETL